MKTILKYAGSKWSYADWIVSLFPEHNFYLEPYFGSGAVLINKPPTKYETVNDLDDMVVNFFRAVRDHPDELAKAVALTPYARSEYRSVEEPRAGAPMPLSGDCVEDARRFAVRCFQGFGSKLADRCGWKNSKKSNGPINPQVWASLPQTIGIVAQRLKNVQIDNYDALALIKAHNAPDCLIYADPPYLGSTRNNKRIYRHEMLDDESHKEMLEALLLHQGPVVLSGYDNELYNHVLQGWNKAQRSGRSDGGAKRVETVWFNFEHQLCFY